MAFLGDTFPDLLNQLVPICKAFIRGGTPKQSKHAVKCLFVNTTETQVGFQCEPEDCFFTNMSICGFVYNYSARNNLFSTEKCM
jgi:hypothetical protein